MTWIIDQTKRPSMVMHEMAQETRELAELKKVRAEALRKQASEMDADSVRLMSLADEYEAAAKAIQPTTAKRNYGLGFAKAHA